MRSGLKLGDIWLGPWLDLSEVCVFWLGFRWGLGGICVGIG